MDEDFSSEACEVAPADSDGKVQAGGAVKYVRQAHFRADFNLRLEHLEQTGLQAHLEFVLSGHNMHYDFIAQLLRHVNASIDHSSRFPGKYLP